MFEDNVLSFFEGFSLACLAKDKEFEVNARH